MRVVNLFSGPAAGKSTCATGIFYTLKSKYNVNCEYVSEYAKILAWEDNSAKLADQFYVTAKQNRSLEILRGKVSYAISDSPLLLGIHYATDYKLKSYGAMVKELFDSYDNVNFFINRKKKFNPAGRFHNEEQSKEIDVKIKELLIKLAVPFVEIDGDELAVERIIAHIFNDESALAQLAFMSKERKVANDLRQFAEEFKNSPEMQARAKANRV